MRIRTDLLTTRNKIGPQLSLAPLLSSMTELTQLHSRREIREIRCQSRGLKMTSYATK